MRFYSCLCYNLYFLSTNLYLIIQFAFYTLFNDIFLYPLDPVSAGRHPGGPNRADGQRLLHRGPGPRAVPGRLLPVPA